MTNETLKGWVAVGVMLCAVIMAAGIVVLGGFVLPDTWCDGSFVGRGIVLLFLCFAAVMGVYLLALIVISAWCWVVEDVLPDIKSSGSDGDKE